MQYIATTPAEQITVTVESTNRKEAHVSTPDGEQYRVFNCGTVWRVVDQYAGMISIMPIRGEGAAEREKAVAIATFKAGALDYCRHRKGQCPQARQIIKSALA